MRTQIRSQRSTGYRARKSGEACVISFRQRAAEPAQANRSPALRAGLSRPIYLSGYDRKAGLNATMSALTKGALWA